jgi:hypothetical protein
METAKFFIKLCVGLAVELAIVWILVSPPEKRPFADVIRAKMIERLKDASNEVIRFHDTEDEEGKLFSSRL